MRDKAIIIVAAVAVIVIAAFGAIWLSGLSVASVQPIEQTTTLVIEGPDAIEVGERVSYSLIIEGELCYAAEFPVINWTSEGGQKLSQEGAEVIVVAHQPGKVVLTATLSGMTTEKVVQVHPRANINLEMKTWIHPEWYTTGVISIGVSEPSLSLYRVLDTGRRVEVSTTIWESFSFKEIVIHEYGNYILVVEGKALSDGRVVKAEKELTVTPYVQRGYHQFSWDNENLVQLTPSDRVAVESFLKEELDINLVLLPEGKLKDANRINNADYVFYKDSSRNDVVIYQTVVSSRSDMVRKMWKTSVKGSDGRYSYLNFDDFIIAVKMGNSATSFISTYNDNGGSSSGGGGPSPSPSIGGGGPSPSPSI